MCKELWPTSRWMIMIEFGVSSSFLPHSKRAVQLVHFVFFGDGIGLME